MDSPIYSYMLCHNVEKIDPVSASDLNDPELASKVVSVSNIVQIKTKDHLYESQENASGKLSACLCVVKPNQPLNVACKDQFIVSSFDLVRTLKSIANNKELGLQIQNLELTHYSDKQIDLVYQHDIEFDEMIPEAAKTQALKDKYSKIFKDGKSPVVQFLVSGPYAISKM